MKIKVLPFKSIRNNFVSDMTDLTANLNFDLDGADVQEFTSEDGRHVKIVKKHADVEE